MGIPSNDLITNDTSTIGYKSFCFLDFLGNVEPHLFYPRVVAGFKTAKNKGTYSQLMTIQLRLTLLTIKCSMTSRIMQVIYIYMTRPVNVLVCASVYAFRTPPTRANAYRFLEANIMIVY